MKRRKLRCVLASWLVMASDCLPGKSDEGPGSDSSAQTADAVGKGSAHTLPLPAPGEQDWHYLAGGDWRYVAPENAGSLYDAVFFDGRWFVLHGTIVNSEKVVQSELNWLSWTRDGLAWDTIALTQTPYESYTRLATNGKSLLLAGIHHIGHFEGDHVVPISALEQMVYPPVMLPYADGYAIARIDDVVWLDLSFDVAVVKVASRASTSPARTRLSRDGMKWSEPLEMPPDRIGPADCEGRCVVEGGRVLLPPVVLNP